MTAEDVADLEVNMVERLAVERVAMDEGDRTPVNEIHDVRVLEDGRVLVVSTGESRFGEQVGDLVLVEEDGAWLVDLTGVIGEPVEINLGS